MSIKRFTAKIKEILPNKKGRITQDKFEYTHCHGTYDVFYFIDDTEGIEIIFYDDISNLLYEENELIGTWIYQDEKYMGRGSTLEEAKDEYERII